MALRRVVTLLLLALDVEGLGIYGVYLPYREDIDGLRAVAVILVVIFHAFPAALTGGYVGVDVFFVISGYVITRKYFTQMTEGTFSFWKFYQARARRLLPALSIVIGATVMFGGLILLPIRYENLGLHGIAGSLFFPNFLVWTEVGYFDAAAETKPLLHLWSLGIEEQFYLLWPLLLILFARTQKKAIAFLAVIVVASFIYSIIETDLSQATAYYNPLARLWELGTGGLIAVAIPNPKRRNIVSFFGLVLISCSAALLTKSSEFPGWRAAAPVVGSALILAYGASFLERRLLIEVGKISYPAYLWHWPLITFATISGLTSAWIMGSIVIASFILAWLTTALVETPIRFGCLSQRSPAIASSMAALVLLMSAAVWFSSGLPQRYPAEIRSAIDTMRYDPVAGARAQTCWIANTATSEFGKECSAGQTLIWGDSHAGRLYTGFSEDRDGQVAQFTRDACLPSFGTNSTVCERSNNDIVNRIAELKPDKLIIFAFWTYLINSEELRRSQMSSLARAVVELRKSVKQIVILGPAPYWSPDLPTRVYENWKSSGTILDRIRPSDVGYKQLDSDLAAVARTSGAQFISIYNAMCNEAGCITHGSSPKGELISWDYGHLTKAGANFVADLVRTEAHTSLERLDLK